MQSNSVDLFPGLLVLFLAIGVAGIGLISYSISLSSGWYSLSKRFRAQAEPYGETRSAGPLLYGVQMRYRVNYGSVIRLTSASDALYLSVLFLFRIGHPPLSIPWNEIKIRRIEFLWFRFVALTLGDQERVCLRISKRMAAKLGILDRAEVSI